MFGDDLTASGDKGVEPIGRRFGKNDFYGVVIDLFNLFDAFILKSDG